MQRTARTIGYDSYCTHQHQIQLIQESARQKSHAYEGFREGPAQEGLARERERILEDAKLMQYASFEVEINQDLQFKRSLC